MNLNKIPTSLRNEAKRDVGEFIVNEILRSVSSGRSPVAGRGAFQRLSTEYADREKGGNRNPNLELDGDMLDALTFQVTSSGVEVGIFDSSQEDKADGHNNFSGESKLPTRRFIPNKDEDFNRNIKSGVEQILNRYREDTDPFDLTGALALGSAFIDTEDISLEEVLGGLSGDLFE